MASIPPHGNLNGVAKRLIFVDFLAGYNNVLVKKGI
jgi:hypothetical protein